jgi:hypothetical protein
MIKSRYLCVLLALAFGLSSFNTAASLFRVDVDFTANNFQPFPSITTYVNPPAANITGSYSFSFDDIGINGTGFDSISNIVPDSVTLVIDDHAYTTSDTTARISFFNGMPSEVGLFHGGPNFSWLNPGSNQFALSNITGPVPVDFPAPSSYFSTMAYTTASDSEYVYYTEEVTEDLIITTIVPIPAAVWLFVYGLFGLIGVISCMQRPAVLQ